MSFQFKETILLETKSLLAINKPSGLIVEQSRFEYPTIEDLAMEYLTKQRKQPYVGIIHRLDRVTSGVLLLAKKKSVLKNLNEQFRNKQVQKQYLAIVEDLPTPQDGILQHWLEKDQKNKRAIIHAAEHPKAVYCELTYRVVAEKQLGYLLQLTPKTGRFHQIRAQLAFIGCPIVGDIKYGSRFNEIDRCIALHAQAIQFQLPNQEKKIEIQAAPPSNDYWQ